MTRRRFSINFYNYITYAGVVLSVFVFCLEVILYLIDTFIGPKTLYLGLVTYLLLPLFLFLGLVLIPAGALRKRRRIRKGLESGAPSPIHIDLSKRTHRNAVLIFVAGTSLFMIASMIGVYKSYHYTDSVEFCGQLCHSVMHPEFTTYHESPHSRIACVQCHIGGGAEWYVRAKLSGTYQVYSTMFNKYPRPIPSPVKDLRPARETCETCHWPEYFYTAKERVYHRFLSDEQNTYWPVRLLLKVGGGRPGGVGQTGIHWHMNINNDIEYVARDDKRQDIAWVRWTNRQTGEVRIYESDDDESAKSQLKERPARKFDCIDCHNRPTHKFPSPANSVNDALITGKLDRRLPFIKREAVKALSLEFSSTEEAGRIIRTHLFEFYQKEYPDILEREPERIEQAVLAVRSIFSKTQFPEMKVRWDTHPDNVGHFEFPGCFRCHGSTLKTADGKTIGKDCSSCHSIMSQGPSSWKKSERVRKKFVHPLDLGMDAADMDCAGCHANIANLY